MFNLRGKLLAFNKTSRIWVSSGMNDEGMSKIKFLRDDIVLAVTEATKSDGLYHVWAFTKYGFIVCEYNDELKMWNVDGWHNHLREI